MEYNPHLKEEHLGSAASIFLDILVGALDIAKKAFVRSEAKSAYEAAEEKAALEEYESWLGYRAAQEQAARDEQEAQRVIEGKEIKEGTNKALVYSGVVGAVLFLLFSYKS